MDGLFNKYLEEGKVSEALLVGQNLLNRNIKCSINILL